MAKGKFIVIDGTDGSGKATQVHLLKKRLIHLGYKVKTIDFPQYYHNFFGKFIGECLSGKYGDFIAVNPYLASVLYAADRQESSAKIRAWLKAGKIVIADRYASSNQIHQGGKILDLKQRKEFLAWLEKMEFKVFKIPKPNLIFYLSVPIAITQKLLAGKEKTQKKRYLKGKKDLAENNIKHLEQARASALKLVEQYNNWQMIDCASQGELKSKIEIADIIWKKINGIIGKKN